MRQPVTPGQGRWLSLGAAALVLALGAVFGALALWDFAPIVGRGDIGLGARIIFGSVAALALFRERVPGPDRPERARSRRR